jgi:geranylgeranyl reductase family protein
MKSVDAAIVGAGPAGCSAAVFLARQGYSVALIDKSTFPREKLCGDFLNPANWEIFQKLGIEDALLALEHEKVDRFRISTASAVATIAFPRQDGSRSFGLGLKRSHFDHLLLRLAEKEGVAIRQGCKLSRLSRDGNLWTLTWGEPAAEQKLNARLLIGADGRSSWVANRLGVAAPKEQAKGFVAFQMTLPDCAGVGGDVQIHLFPGGYAGLTGSGGGLTNLCFVVEKKIARESPTVGDLVKKYLFKNPHLKEPLQERDMSAGFRSVYPVYFSPRRSFGGGFLLAGDAAQVTEPVTGEGVYFALRSGELAAAAVARAFQHGDLSARQLSGYHLECRKALAGRHLINRFIRAIMQRPYLAAPLINVSAKNNLPIRALVNLVCRRTPAARS